jgi:hypothetical protein
MQNAALEEARHPISGIDYPGTFQDFDKRFSSENARLEYIAKLRWPKFAENVNGKLSFLQEHSFMGVTHLSGRGFLLSGLCQVKNMVSVLSD